MTFPVSILNDQLGRVGGLRVEGESADLAAYEFCGLDRFVKIGYVQPGVDLNYIIPGGDTGGPYGGWDRFGRTENLRWLKGAAAIEQVLHGYNEGSQRTWRENPVAATNEDECYQYDGLYQLVGRQRGNLNLNESEWDPRNVTKA